METRGFHWVVHAYTQLPHKATVMGGIKNVSSKANVVLLESLDFDYVNDTFSYVDRAFALDDLHLSPARSLGFLTRGDRKSAQRS